MVDRTMSDGPATDVTHPSARTTSSAREERSAFQFNDREGADARDRESLSQLLSDLTREGSHLADQQMSLMRAEMQSAMTDLKESIAALAGAAVLGIAALGVLLMAASFLLGTAMPLWVGTLIVAVVALGIAYAMFATGKKRIQSNSMTMDRTRHTIERAPAAMLGNEREVRRGR